MLKVSFKVRINIFWPLVLLYISKKVKKALRTRLCGSKTTWLEHLLDKKSLPNEKHALNAGALACYENLLIQEFTLTNNIQSFFFVCVAPKINCSLMEVYTKFPQITQKILITGTFHWLELITVILDFLKIFSVRETTTQCFYHFRIIIFLNDQGSNFQVLFWIDYVFLLMSIICSCKNSSCV